MTESTDPRIADLAARIAAGETIDVDSLPGDLRDLPSVGRLLDFSRIAAGIARNAQADAPTPTAPDRIGAWRLLRLLGSGGMGDVWLGERADGTVDHRVAIKRVRGASPMFIARLEAERRILASLSHPNIARFIDAGIDASGSPWLALDYIDGESLDAWLERTQPSLRQRIALFLAVCGAVEHAHRQLVVHRDIKPANLIVDGDGTPHLLDFGVAKLLDDRNGHETTAALLTPAYAAPEQLRGGQVSTATDVYALGLVLYRMLAGALPATRVRGSVVDVIAHLDDEETQRPSDTARHNALPYPATMLGGDLDAIVSKAIRAEPAARYGSVAALADDLQRHLDARPVKARAPTRWYRFSRYARRNRIALALALFAAMALLTGSAVALWQARAAGVAAAEQAREAARADREAATARTQAQRAKQSAQFVLSVFQQADLLRRDGRGAISIDEAFEDALERIDSEFSDDAMVAADLNDDFAEILASKGRFDEADQRLRKALALAEQAHGPNGLPVAETLLNLTVVAAYRGRPLDGKATIERALSILTTHPEADPLEIANARVTLSNILGQEGRNDEARAEMEAALAIYRERLPDSDQRVSIAIFNLAATLHTEGNWTQAQPYFDEAQALTEKDQGNDSAALLPILDFQATNLDNLGRHDEAEATLRKMLDIANRAYPDANPHRAAPMMELGHHLLRRGDVDAGVALLRQGIAMAQALESPLAIFGWRWLAKDLLARQRWDEAADAARTGDALCGQLKRQTQSRCIDLRLLALLARIGADPAADIESETSAVVADIERAKPGGETPALLHRLRAARATAAGDHAAALGEWTAARDALAMRYVPTHRDVIDADAAIAGLRDRR